MLLLGVFVAALGLHAWYVTRNWTTPFLMGHEFRQTQTAINSYYIDQQDNFSLLYETPVMGKPWVSVLMEVPLYEWAVVGLSRLIHVPHYIAARSISLACFYLMLPALYLLLGRCQLAPAHRLVALALILVCPVYIFYSRAFLMDSMALMCCAWFLFGYVRMLDERRWYWFLLATLAGTGAALIKSATLAIWLWLAAAYVAGQLWRDWRRRAGEVALAETVFWAVAGVIVPLGLLEMWIQLTDPLKASHASAWIFTSRNLSAGNWGLTDLGARFSPKVWRILAERWHEAIMPPGMLLALLGLGLLFLPPVRRPALALAGIFFWAQVLFPYAYAYQDYYFYSCAVFLLAGFGYLLVGLLDSRLPRWLVWLLFVVPFAAQIITYQQGYYPLQRVRSEGGFPFTSAIRNHFPKDCVIVVAGDDWAAIIPYYAQRKALMIRNGLENDVAYLDRAFADLATEDVGALVLVNQQMGNQTIITRAAAAFGTDRVPSFSSPHAEVYCNLLYRDRIKADIKNAGNYGELVNEPLAPVPAPGAQPFRISEGLARSSFPMVYPAPIRARFEYGFGHVWLKDRKAIFAHPQSDLWIPSPSAATRIEWEFGIISDAYEREGAKTDGVEFTITALAAGGRERVIFRRYLAPVDRPADRGIQQEVIAYRPLPGEILRFSSRPGAGAGFDWAYWLRIGVK